MIKGSVEALLDELLRRTQMTYMSDLHQRDRLREVAAAAERVRPEDYAPQEWSKAVAYILGEYHDFESPRAALDFLAARAHAGPGKE